MLVVADRFGAEGPDRHEAEGEVERGQQEVHPDGRPAVLTRELAEARGEGEWGFRARVRVAGCFVRRRVGFSRGRAGVGPGP